MFQLFDPHQAGGPNRCNLIEAQVNFVQFGACERSMSKNVRPAAANDVRDAEWFPLWARRTNIPDGEADARHPQHMSSIYELYYWLRN